MRGRDEMGRIAVGVSNAALAAAVLAGCSSNEESVSALTCTDANIETISASTYDQSCTTAADCVGVGEGNACYPCVLACPTAAINAASKSSYDTDVAKTSGAARRGSVTCHCPALFAPCCIQGKCHADVACSDATP